MKKIFPFALILYNIMIFNQCKEIKKTCIIPLSDAYPNRYFYHTPFQYDQFDTDQQWLCKGNCTIRYQNSRNNNTMTSFLFDNPIVVTANGFNNTYNGGVLGLGFKNINSQSNIELKRNSYFIDCTVEITRLNIPYYLHIGIPVQRTEQSIIFKEKIYSDEEVIKGGFTKEYQINSIASIIDWKNTPSSIFHSISGMKQYLEGTPIGNLVESRYGKLPPCPMTLWALADVYLQIGYDGLCYKKANIGYYLRAVIPTSPALKSAWNQYMFYPTIGNVDRWEFDFGINGNINLKNNDRDVCILYFDALIGYLAPTWHMRPFDLKNGFFSRYGQVKIFDLETVNYKNSNIRAVDITTQEYQIGNCVKSEIVLDFVYQRYQSFWNFGYSFKSQSKENISCDQQLFYEYPNNTIQLMYGYSPQQYTQTPNPNANDSNQWTCNLITPRSGMTYLANEDVSLYRDTNEHISGIMMNEKYQMKKTDLNFDSGIMPMQILNIIFIGYSYEKINSLFNTIIGIKGGVSFSPKTYYTPTFYEGMIFLELDY